MLPEQFDYAAPTTVQAAVKTLASQPDAMVVAGNYREIIDLKMRRIAPHMLIDLRKIPELQTITANVDDLQIGAMVTLRALMDDETVRSRFAALAEAAALSGDPQVRNMDSIGGSLSYRAQD